MSVVSASGVSGQLVTWSASVGIRRRRCRCHCPVSVSMSAPVPVSVSASVSLISANVVSVHWLVSLLVSG